VLGFVYLMRFDAMRCDALRCDAMRLVLNSLVTGQERMESEEKQEWKICAQLLTAVQKWESLGWGECSVGSFSLDEGSVAGRGASSRISSAFGAGCAPRDETSPLGWSCHAPAISLIFSLSRTKLT